MRAYLSVLSARFKTLIQYRAAAFAGYVTQLFWGLIRLMILIAFYESTQTSQPMTFAMVISYIWLSQAFLGLIAWNLDRDVRDMVRTGAIAYELLRPLDMYWLWYARSIAWRTATAALRSFPLVITAAVIVPLVGLGDFALGPPPTVLHGLAFAVSLSVTVALSGALTTFNNITLMWTVSGEGIALFLPAIGMFGSGLVIPLPLLPDWMQPVIFWLPFRGLADVPFRIYSGHIPLSAAPLEIGLQAAWTVVIIILGRYLISRGMRKVSIQGG